ncbi:MAG TPA: aminotransferase class IV, partial [Desulfobacteria bacterium]|nr:aminotransferase class IV [Desulfobacteria bacterium]
DAYIRLTYSRGPGPIGLDPALCPKGTLVIMAKPMEVPEHLYRKGMSVGICPIRRNPAEALPPEVKSQNFLNNILAKIWAKESNYSDAVLLSTEGWVAESTVSNVFFIKDDKLFTPGLKVGLLPGITREYILQTVRRAGIEYAEGYYTSEDLFSAAEVFLTNSGSEIIPVVNIDGKIIGDGKPGIWTSKIHTLFRALVKESLGIDT